ncbi:MAG: sensor histidine kinase [Bacteroidota bacterium]
MWNLQVQGWDFYVIEDYVNECFQFSNRYHLSFSARLAEAMRAGWVEPMKKNYAPLSMAETLKQWEEDNHIASVGSYYVHRGLTHYYCGEYEAAGRCLEVVRRYLSGLTDNVLKRQWHVFLVLNALKLYERDQDHQTKEEFIDWIRPIIKKIETWAALGPLLKPYLALLYAELERVTGDWREARNRYLDAINLAHEQEYLFLEGYLYESLGELLRRTGQHPEKLYFVEAARLYRKCRAERKEISLREKYPEYFEEEKTASGQFEPGSANRSILPELDVDYLIKSSLAIAAEIEQDALLKKVMNVVLQSSGAQRGFLLIEEEGDLYIRAGSQIGAKQVARTVNEKLEDAVDICKAIVRYVYRTKERLILSNAMEEGIFKDNQEIHDLQSRSVLCLPVIKQTRMIGILYLENRLADGVFTAEKTQLTELLTSQAAISIENARLIEEMKKAEEQIKESLQEKEALLTEIHHRVKNNLQIIQSMLNLQMPYIKDEQAIELFKESKNRIYLMALIHEKLYRSESLAKIDLPEYIRSLVRNLFLTYGVSEINVKTKIFIEDVTLNVDTIIPCALIINELVSNSLKHAFQGLSGQVKGSGEIEINLRQDMDSQFILTVSDNGIGMPNNFELQNCQSLGLKLVNVLVRQLSGEIVLNTNGKTEFTITFTELKRSRRLTK